MVVPLVKVRKYARYKPALASQNARFCESKAPFVTTGFLLKSDHRMPSAEWNANSPPCDASPPSALKRDSGGQPGRVSKNGAKLCVPTPVQMMLLSRDPLYS